MRCKIIWLILSCLMIAALALASCTTTVEEEEEEGSPVTEEEEEEEEEEGPPTGANWWDEFGEPEYGGTIVYRTRQLSPSFDVLTFLRAESMIWFDTLWKWDWTLDRKIWPFVTGFTPDEYYVGNLAESWEIPDPQTVIAHIREGVHWQDKPPVNGREFTAYDVEQHYDRMLGTGSGYTTPTPMYAGLTTNWQKVTATDKYTVVFEFKQPSGMIFQEIADTWSFNYIEAPESVKLEGGLGDWKKAVGTGPWMLIDYLSGSSMTFSKNPNYWGYDERHPENQVPYVDKFKVLLIPDVATALAGLRTGKIDIIGGEVGILNWQQAQALAKTNPELQQVQVLAGSDGVGMRCDKAPFTDIRVRKALQIAIDRDTIAKTHYGGTVDGKPCGIISPLYKGYCFAYEDWPQELKDEYSYNPTKAKQLLAEAGYPDGFETNCVVRSDRDLDIVQIFQGYFKDIGVDMEIEVMEGVAWLAFTRTGQHDQMFSGGGGSVNPPKFTLPSLMSTNPSNTSFNNDAAYDAIVAEWQAAIDPAELKRLCAEADRCAIEKHWSVIACPTAGYNAWQPYIKGYSGEYVHWGQGQIWARLWIDQDLKESMGR